MQSFSNLRNLPLIAYMLLKVVALSCWFYCIIHNLFKCLALQYITECVETDAQKEAVGWILECAVWKTIFVSICSKSKHFRFAAIEKWETFNQLALKFDKYFAVNVSHQNYALDIPHVQIHVKSSLQIQLGLPVCEMNAHEIDEVIPHN